MKKISIVFLLLILSVAIKAADDLNIVFIGNSISYGATLQNPSTEAAPVRACEYIEQTGQKVHYRNCGVSGMTTVDFLPACTHQFPNVVKNADELSKLKGKLIFSISLGTNDSSDDCFGAPVVAEQYYTNLQVIIDELLNRYPKATVVIQYPIWYSPNTYNGARYMQKGLNRLQTYPAMIDLLAKHYLQLNKHVFSGSKRGFDFFKENYKLFTAENGNAGIFYLHPNKEGAVELGKIWAEGILKLL